MATNVLKFCRACIANWVAFVVGVLDVDCATECALAGDYFWVWQWH